ncbi:SusE domain-containing protein [Flavobacterium capsici]|uniref:SusE domain-containing protein n=1 Tax=Flavobacterium capsici TaxID=3075618 RepID=A0AA96EZT3_9FLAO|nr:MULTISPECIES: SusE domain-containing protein [unclassified Flavobacterium]WNM19960.1 SusE domain-containing protein [Flavobacterium sp. PMR2A8]WNM21349.1 SusE domain-containing protein [Flavobacterium sp. PMTSA4]
MKKILKISSLAFLLIAGVACENDDQRIIQAEGGPELISPAIGTEFVLAPENAASEATTLVWNHADYSQQTAVNYDIEVALAGTEFATIVSGGSTNNRFYVWSVEALNTVALDAGLTPYTAGDLDIRVKASLGANDVLESYSNTITITVTPYTTETPKLWMPGSYQSDSGYGNNWTQSTAATLASEGFGNTNFEGYVYFASAQAAPNDGFKFTDAPDWNNGIYGDDGTFSGTLTSPGDNIGVTPGYYRVTANTTALTYNLTPMTWAIIGNATVGGWSTDTPMTYNPTTKKWFVITTLSAQTAPTDGMKFRANGSWDVNLGDSGADGTMEYSGDNIGTSAGTYLIELDLSNPRQYTYTLTAQ